MGCLTKTMESYRYVSENGYTLKTPSCGHLSLKNDDIQWICGGLENHRGTVEPLESTVGESVQNRHLPFVSSSCEHYMAMAQNYQPPIAGWWYPTKHDQKSVGKNGTIMA